MCYYVKKVNKNETERGKVSNLERMFFMTKAKYRFNKKRFFKFMFIVSTFFISVITGNGDITGALVLTMLI